MTEGEEKTVLGDQPAPEHVHGPDCDHDHHAAQPYRRATEKVGRNDPCTCGSGKKFKKCCDRTG
jgi:preprotein translocase subunit SecA